MNTPQQPLIPETKQWLVREKTQSGTSKGDDLGPFVRKITVELVYGVWKAAEKATSQPRIVGESYHTLSGPTARKSIQKMADDLNAKGTIPEDKEPVKTRLDGYRQSFNEAGGESLFDAMTLKSTISYAPERKQA